MNTTFFHKQKKCSDGFRGKCKDCRKRVEIEPNRQRRNERCREWRSENREKAIKDGREYYWKNKDKCNNLTIEYQKKNKEKVRKKQKEYRDKRKEHYKEFRKNYYAENKDYYKEKHAEWVKKNPEKAIAISRKTRQKRRSLRKQLPATLTTEQWEQIVEDFDSRCAYCGKPQKLTQEHFVSVSHGGGYTHNNIIPACRSCNSKKHNKDFFEWYPDSDCYSKKREKFILDYLGYNNNTQQLRII